MVRKYQEAIDLLTEALELVEQGSVSHGVVDSLGKQFVNCRIVRCTNPDLRGNSDGYRIEWMESLIEAMSGDTISQILFRNNQGKISLAKTIRASTQWGNRKYMNMKHLEAVLDETSIAG